MRDGLHWRSDEHGGTVGPCVQSKSSHVRGDGRLWTGETMKKKSAKKAAKRVVKRRTTATGRPRANRPGKFEGSGTIGKKLWEITLNGMHDAECGESDTTGWYGLVTKSGVRGAANAIVSEDSQGFVDYETFPSAEAAKKRFKKIEAEIDAEEEVDKAVD